MTDAAVKVLRRVPGARSRCGGQEVLLAFTVPKLALFSVPVPCASCCLLYLCVDLTCGTFGIVDRRQCRSVVSAFCVCLPSWSVRPTHPPTHPTARCTHVCYLDTTCLSTHVPVYHLHVYHLHVYAWACQRMCLPHSQ